MIPITLNQLAQVTQGRIINATNHDLILLNVSTDSRKIEASCLFIALKGERFDAHEFARQVVEAGATALLVDHQLDVNCPQVIVEDTRIAMGQVAGWVRQQSKARVVGLTGSSGKTSVKEMTASILGQRGNTLYTAGNLNNDIGVPLTLFRLTDEYQFAVIEMGANHPHEIEYTTNIVKPETALVNNLFGAHLAGFGSPEGVAKAKGEIYQGLPEEGTAIVNLDSYSDKWQFGSRQTVWYYSLTEKADFYPSNIQIKQLTTDFTLHTPVGQVEITLPLPGVHNIANVLAASALAISVGATLEDIKQGIATTKAVPGRLFPVRLSDTKVVLDDTYNANDGSMIAAINVLAKMPGYRILVAGDMGELGDYAHECHERVGLAAKQAGLDKVLSVGQLSEIISQSSERGEHFTVKQDLLTRLIPLAQQNDVVSILVKGSRSSAMEDVVNALKECFEC
ncbi:UDP-N-acetylmuramoyl-tripeptide--D-alanyl-D-alanine ligase [Providencia alcalifaciens]|uniref:UDP-N-acetylmuramoyl-tripeptide--D-alanyl-D-alanine ligase n=2 Tax=Providencia alcalifaciens TaxID=126385 RepID=A0AAW9V7F5_9GAMM|nr:UDP-N-acetylmuramoyl-tripeptide--D-alanyl-D-alanine ligase [Providencia alcalifaciens]EUD09127.1 UDP-N-acetylmuramoyl-tripeptide--D-alanyl-D-alanine ligase [Providencia alcalifaciens 205/92]MTC16185.1 UDP-N-acetylmuramoyl-tripeptide--D-alanyl-D-alanine ligase [Providencia alcalifaciens]MTC33730.1 UDP-N-acetylmuramoyl-tripeptide--D-alanyl-D-alanine ligase [Providencia alcalifaciens]MTC65292.1 UDP-N-acetylmuramoyl-tripeptide--D-alanyl-D-alanine ligase [Providencia alcalifaciens]WGZ54670.1 UDP